MTGLRPLPPELVTREELADMMRCSVATVDRMKRDGMPHVSWGRRMVRFRPGEAMRWAETQQQRKAA